MSFFAVSFALLFAFAARPPESCPPLSVTADGEEIRMVAGFGVRAPKRLGGGWIVAMYNHREVDCAAFLGPGRRVREDELEARAYVSKEHTNMSVNFSNEMGAKVRLVETPRKPGGRISVCVPEPIEHTGEMAYKRKLVVVHGLLTGTYCGEAK